MTESEKEINCSGTVVRVFRPRVVLLGFHGTIAPSDWEDQCIAPYVQENILSFLSENWSQPNVMELISKLRDQSFDQHFVYETPEVPLILSFDVNCSNWRIVVKSVSEFVQWQMKKTSNMSKETLLLIKLCWTDGYQTKKIQTKIFDDVRPALEKWRSEYQIRFAIMAPQINEPTFKMLLKETTSGDLTEFFEQYFDPISLNTATGKYFENISRILNIENHSDILLITDYGQYAKQAHDHGYQSVIMIRPGNRKPRSYYMLRFPTTRTFKNIEFVDK